MYSRLLSTVASESHVTVAPEPHLEARTPPLRHGQRCVVVLPAARKEHEPPSPRLDQHARRELRVAAPPTSSMLTPTLATAALPATLSTASTTTAIATSSAAPTVLACAATSTSAVAAMVSTTATARLQPDL
jgi:hypothetical protein